MAFTERCDRFEGRNMKKKLSFLIIYLIFSAMLFSESQICIPFYETKEYKKYTDTAMWSYNVQKAAYLYFYEKKDFESIKDFYNFISDIKTATYKSMDFCNPCIIAILEPRYRKFLINLYDYIPDSFLRSDYSNGGPSDKPIIFAVRYGGVESVKIFFEKKIPINLDQLDLFEPWDAGGSRYPYGFNLMTVADGMDKNYNKRMIDYLYLNGCEREEKSLNVEYYIVDKKNVYSEPGFNNSFLDVINPSIKIKVEKITMFKQDGYQWAKISYGKNKSGWITVANLRHITKGDGI